MGMVPGSSLRCYLFTLSSQQPNLFSLLYTKELQGEKLIKPIKSRSWVTTVISFSEVFFLLLCIITIKARLMFSKEHLSKQKKSFTPHNFKPQVRNSAWWIGKKGRQET
jgi:hypothetical protein